MSYFKKVKKNDKVFGLVYGEGVVISVWENSFYSFEVQYKNNGSVVPYTEEGFPAWNTSKFDFQTVFYANDLNFTEQDFTPINEILSVKKIIKLRNKNKLEVRCPSGLWQSFDKCPNSIAEEYLQDNKFHLFRKKIVK
jgi:hypothetical protein